MRSDRYKNESTNKELSYNKKQNKLAIVFTIIILIAIVAFIVFTIKSIYGRSTAPLPEQSTILETGVEKPNVTTTPSVAPLENNQIVEEEIDEYAIMQRGNDPEHVEFETQTPDPYAKAKEIYEDTKQQQKADALKQEIIDVLSGVDKGGETKNE